MLAFGALPEDWMLPVRKMRARDAVIAFVLSARRMGLPDELTLSIGRQVFASWREPVWDHAGARARAVASGGAAPSERGAGGLWGALCNYVNAIIES